MKTKTKIFYALALCILFSAFIAGCSGEVTPPHDGDAENEILTSALLLKFDGVETAHIPSGITPNQLSETLCSLKQSEFTEKNIETKSIELENKIELVESMCRESEIKSAESVSEELYQRGQATFTSVIIQKEDAVLPFKTVYENSSAHYEGTSVTKTEGKEGKSLITYELTYSGDEEISKVKVSEETVSKVQNKVILVGTKKSTASTGSYAWPLKSITVTSNYGARTLNGKYDFHYGTDFRAAVGTSVYASDGGKIIYAGRLGTYGILVKIEHDNGNVTYYAHLSSYSVKVGQRVYKGQAIAKSGATGNVTGPHLHFEIRIAGKHKDPLLYLNKKSLE